MIGYANPLRGIASDAAGLTALVRSLEVPIVLVGHSYGGAVITNVPADAGDIIALVYVAGFALDAAESPGTAASLVPGGTLGETLRPVPLADGGADLYIAADKYHGQFCADLPAEEAALLAVTQRPITEAALNELRGGSLVAVGPALVHLRRWRPEHPGRRAKDHGRARRGETRCRDRRCVPRGRRLTPFRDRSPDRRSRGLRRPSLTGRHGKAAP